jgi:prepilin-type processing-associated H-X9-DG protein
MIQKTLEEGGTGHIKNKAVSKPQRPTGVYPDTIILWDGAEVAPNFNVQYVQAYALDAAPGAGKFTPTNGIYGLLGSPKKPTWRYRNVNSLNRNADPKNFGENYPIYPGINEDVGAGNGDQAVGGIRWRHGRNDAANFLFADGSVKTFTITKNWNTTPRGDLLRKYFRSKIPSGYSPIDVPG